MKLAIILPVHDEASVLARSVMEVFAWADAEFGPGNFAIVVSENGSADDTRSIGGRLSRELAGVSLVVSDAAGKGGAIKRAAAAVEADVYVFMDIDLSTDLASAAEIVRAVGPVELAIGSRRARGSEVERPWTRRLITSVYATVLNAVLRLGVADAQCGCKAFSRRLRDEVLPRVEDDGFFFDTELIARARLAGMKLSEIGVRWKEKGAFARKSKVRLLTTSLAFIRKLAELRRRMKFAV